MPTIYLDSNATSKPAPEVVDAVNAALTRWWENPSSAHRPGHAVEQQVALAREAIAGLLGCREREIVFTSGGTEADNLALLGTAAVLEDRPLVVTMPLEHSAIRDTADHLAARGREIAFAGCDEHGVVRLDELESLLDRRGDEIAIVSIMWCNNETGVIQPIESIGAICRDRGVRFHTDAVQWVGKMPTRCADLPVDLLSFSAHKFHGPKGVGGLYVRRGVRLEPRALGGGQERARRGGTENVPGILGMAAAARVASAWLETGERERLEAVRDGFERAFIERTGDAVVNGRGAQRMWNTANIGFPRLEAEAILLLLSERGLCASAGAACSSGSLDPSPVLLAMGIDPAIAHGSVRFSLSRETTQEEIDEAVEIVAGVIARLRESLSAV
jgi:cysteine desulfurase